MPYTPGSTFTVENAYKQNGIAPVNNDRQVQDNENGQADNSLSDIRSRAQNLVNEASRAISDVKIKEKAQTIWDSVVNLFR